MRGRDKDATVRRELLDEAGLARVLRRIAHEIAERHQGGKDVALVGIRTGGLHLAERIQGLLNEAEGAAVPLGAVDIALYRDDIFAGLPRPEIGPTELPFSLPGRRVILVDDVLYTGRTVRAALDALMDFGRPRAVELAVLVDRGHRELPIQADYVGIKAETTAGESVRVMLRELGEPDRVVVLEKAA
ncbi:MAG TPA: bifunctional pyr operon transcriptional regulator/uracil phosphoribosyltransferase PyrR [Haliangiales bacterium]|nr:bifunctional pyr operon transcriptional regulator/uracil phosphoribosyltransferase PyrR [Haliangiales bacterium]